MNKEEKRLYDKAYQEKHKERIKAYKTSEEYKAKRRATRDLEKNREECRAYYAKNKEKILARAKEHQKLPEVKAKTEETKKRYYLKQGKQRGLDKIKNLDDTYIKLLFTQRSKSLTFADIPQELVEAKRLEVQIKREVLANLPKQTRERLYRERSKARNPNAHKEYYEANKQKCLEAGKLWRQKNKEKWLSKSYEWRKANIEKIRAQERARYHIKKLSTQQGEVK
jgi:hypothetical protein